MNTNTFSSIFNYLELTRRSNIINAWLLGINSAILLFVLKNSLNPSATFSRLIEFNCFKISYIILIIWISINVILLIIYTYKEKILSLVIEDKYHRLKSFMFYIDSIDKISEKELLEKDIFEVYLLAKDKKSQAAINEYIDYIFKKNMSLVKWSNNRLKIYKFVIFGSIPLAIVSFIIILDSIKLLNDSFQCCCLVDLIKF